MIAHEILSLWESFYVIVGSSAGALTGLQFVVMALISDSEMTAGLPEIDAFGSPNIVHFSAALLISAILSAPWPTLLGAAMTVGLCGAFGVVYTGIVIRRAGRVTQYKPVLEDWIWHACLPLASYIVILIAAVLLPRYHVISLFGIAGAALLLLFIGIHNAWDTVTYITIAMKKPQRTSSGGGNDASAP
jgi:hypothetical protein